MRKILFGLLLAGSTLFSEVIEQPATVAFVNNPQMKIIDIRTEGEWVETGVIRNAILLTFFDEKGGVDIDLFLKELNKVVDKDEKFAIICNTGSRTKLISNFLGKKMDYRVVNLTGGMTKLFKEGFNPEYYAGSETNSTK
jgi:rhodanese-related sulfurtransferase